MTRIPFRTTPIFLSLFLLAPVAAQANLMLLTEAQFTSDTVGLSTIVEDFEALGGASDNPLTFGNGTITVDAVANALVDTSPFACGSADDACLVAQSFGHLRTIDAFPAGSTHWSSQLFFNDPMALFEITVTGGSGSLELTTSGEFLDGFIGFRDPLGITSVSFLNLGFETSSSITFRSYSFDNITTASVTAVPVPATLLLFGLGLAGLGFGVRRR